MRLLGLLLLPLALWAPDAPAEERDKAVGLQPGRAVGIDPGRMVGINPGRMDCGPEAGADQGAACDAPGKRRLPSGAKTRLRQLDPAGIGIDPGRVDR